MIARGNNSCRFRSRRGSVLVEHAVVLPLVFLLACGLFEFARLMIVADTLVSAAQEGCRTGVIPGSNSADVKAEVDSVLSSSLVSGATLTTNPVEIATLRAGEPLTVSITIPLDAVSWLPKPQFLGGKVLKSSCTMLREGR